MSNISFIWIEGEPTVPGFYLTRWDNGGNIWVRFYEVVRDPGLPRRMLYMDNYGGYPAHAMTVQGKLTHHCKPTAANFNEALREICPTALPLIPVEGTLERYEA